MSYEKSLRHVSKLSRYEHHIQIRTCGIVDIALNILTKISGFNQVEGIILKVREVFFK